MSEPNGSVQQEQPPVPQRFSSLPPQQRNGSNASLPPKESSIETPVIAVTEEPSPAEKAAKAKENISSTGFSKAFEKGQQKHSKGQLATDLETSDASSVMQAVANANAKPVAAPPQDNSTGQKDEVKPPGAFVHKNKLAQAGWTSFSKLPNPGDEKAMEDLSKEFNTDALVEMYKGSRNSNGSEALSNDLLAQYLNESYYGEWYHNAGVMLFSVVFTWLITKLGGGLMACLVVGAFLGNES